MMHSHQHGGGAVSRWETQTGPQVNPALETSDTNISRRLPDSPNHVKVGHFDYIGHLGSLYYVKVGQLDYIGH